MAEIRSYTPSDYKEVKKILELGDLFWEVSDTVEEFRSKIQRDPESILVAVEDGRVVGVQFIVMDFLSFLFRLAVHPNYRNSGIGQTLILKGEEIIKKRGHSHINVIVNADNPKLQEWYIKKGYQQGHNYVWMFKKFNNSK